MNRAQICAQAASGVRASRQRLSSLRAVIGMDGFVDSIIEVVSTRKDFKDYTPVPTIAAFADKVQAAAGKSANYEFVVTATKLGGNGPLYADALAMAGVGVDYVGSLGLPTPNPVFERFSRRARLHTICEPGYTDAVEFSDGKLMLGKITQLAGVNWDNLVAKVGLETFRGMCDAADLIAMNNWTMLPHLGEIWSHVCSDILPSLSPRPRRVFIDLADPEKRTTSDLLRDLATLSAMERHARVTLGLNLKEASQVATALDLPAPADANDQILSAARSIRARLTIETVVIHPRRGAGAATPGAAAWFDGPMVNRPRLSTGAGDNFNAGFSLGQLAGLSLEQCLACGCASSGFYVRNAASPASVELADFLENLPVPEAPPLAAVART